MAQERVLWAARFNPKVRQYWLLAGSMGLTLSIVGIPLLVIWIPLGLALTQRYLDSIRCVLTEKSLKVERGIFFRSEKTVPLDKITDLALVQGPIMRFLSLEAISIETAGQSSSGALVQLTGVEQARKFRDAVLEQRDLVVSHQPESAAALPADENLLSVMSEVRDILLKLEQKIPSKPD